MKWGTLYLPGTIPPSNQPAAQNPTEAMNEPLLHRILMAALLLAFVAHRGYYNRKFPPAEETVSRMERSATSTLAALFSLLALGSSVLYVVAPAFLTWASAPFPAPARWFGVVVAPAGFALLEWSHRALAANWSDQPRLMRGQELVRAGPYRWIRHPMYAAFLLILGSTLLISANWLVGLSWLIAVGLDAVVRIRYEERVLEERFGREYQAYRATTGRLFPRF